MNNKNYETIKVFMEYIKTLSTQEFMKCMFLCFCAPTIKGIKSASLINFRRHKHEDMHSLWKKHADEWLMPLKLNYLMLNEKIKSKNALVLIYRRELLTKILRCNKACDILCEYGYPLNDIDACLECLREKFSFGFPHEIGIFLDYPPEDVRGFIEKKCAKNLDCPCYWKVYGNEKKAKELFMKYKRAECEAAQEILMSR